MVAHAPLAERFWRFVTRAGDDECWLWNGALYRDGYGSIKTSRPRRQVRAHRASYELFVGPIADGLMVLHRCDVRACVNPKHLFLGTAQDNFDDCRAKGRAAHQVAPERLIRRGEASPVAKLTERDVREILATPRLYGSTAALARKFKVSTRAIKDVLYGLSWTHIERGPNV